MARYIITWKDEAKRYKNYEEWEPYSEWDDPNFLVDTEAGEVLFSDQCEPEDATLHRAFAPLVDLLNKLDKESELF